MDAKSKRNPSTCISVTQYLYLCVQLDLRYTIKEVTEHYNSKRYTMTISKTQARLASHAQIQVLTHLYTIIILLHSLTLH
jgi:hypothetical protein